MNVRSFFQDADLHVPENMRKMRASASLAFTIYLWIVACAVSLMAFQWSGDAFIIAIGVFGFAAIGTLAYRQSPDAFQSRLLIATSMIGNWIILIYASSWFGGGEFVLDAHMLYFIINAVLLAYICWRVILVINTIVVVHHVMLSVFAPLFIWPSEEFVISHFLLHGLMAGIVTPSGVWLAHRVDRLFVEADQALTASEAGKCEAESQKKIAQDATLSAQSSLEQAQAAQAQA